MKGPGLRVFGRDVVAFRLLGALGIASGVVVVVLLSGAAGLAPGPSLAVAGSGASAFFLAVGVRAVVRGVEDAVLWHDLLVVLGAASLALFAWDLPVLAHLDGVALGAGVALALGRVGCLLAGCCHGRPARRGIRYGRAHAARGFPACYVGVPLVPVQALEAGWLTVVVVVGVVTLLGELPGRGPSPPGTALGWFLSAYAGGRFALELLRGDQRPHVGRLSEPQWASLVVVAAVAALEAADVFPGVAGRAWLPAVLAMAVSAVAWRRFRGGGRLLEPAHVLELARTIRALESRGRGSDSTPTLARTSRGVRLSAGVVDHGGSETPHWTVSLASGKMDRDQARYVLGLVRRLVGEAWDATTVIGDGGIHHLVGRDDVRAP